MAEKFTSANFEEEVLQSTIPVVVDFYAEWCGPCKMMGPIVDRVAEEFQGKVKVGKLNIDESIEVTQKYRVMSVPTFVVFKEGKAEATFVGGMSYNDFVAKIEDNL